MCCAISLYDNVNVSLSQREQLYDVMKHCTQTRVLLGLIDGCFTARQHKIGEVNLCHSARENTG